ncbi:MAG: chorismate mutase [Planctomycetota bacterium]
MQQAAIVCRGVRGATTVESDDRDEILRSTTQLLALMIRRNGIESRDVASALFTVTKDMEAEFPALAARQLGWIEVPLLCGYEISVPGSLPRCIRVLLHWNTDKTQSDIHHVYIRDAVRLRPDLSKVPQVDFEELERWIESYLQEEDDSDPALGQQSESEAP